MEGMDMGSMKGMEGMQGMKGMESMPGMEMGNKKEMTGAETRQMNGLTLSLTTAPEKPKAGNVLLKLTLTDQAGKPVALSDALNAWIKDSGFAKRLLRLGANHGIAQHHWK